MIDLDAIVAKVTGKQPLPLAHQTRAEWRIALWQPRKRIPLAGKTFNFDFDGETYAPRGSWGSALQIRTQDPSKTYERRATQGVIALAIDDLWHGLCQRTPHLPIEVCSTCEWMIGYRGFQEAVVELDQVEPSYMQIVNARHVRGGTFIDPGPVPRRAWTKWRPVLHREPEPPKKRKRRKKKAPAFDLDATLKKMDL